MGVERGGSSHEWPTYSDVVNESSPMIFASPKSANLTVRFLSHMSMFSGLRSRWTIFRSCCLGDQHMLLFFDHLI